MANQMPRAWAIEWEFPLNRLDELCAYCDELRAQFGVDVLRDDVLAAVADPVEPLRHAVYTAAREVVIPALHALMLRHRHEAQHLRPRRRQEVVRLVTRQEHEVQRLLRKQRQGTSYAALNDALHAACVQRRRSPTGHPELELALRMLAVAYERALRRRDPADMLSGLDFTYREVMQLFAGCPVAGSPQRPPTRRPRADPGRVRVAVRLARWTAEHSPDGKPHWTACAKIALVYGWPLRMGPDDTPEVIGERLRKDCPSQSWRAAGSSRSGVRTKNLEFFPPRTK
jgi:hypothetical protein